MRITIRVRPGASRTAIGGEHDGALVVRVTPRAVDGKATEAALAAVAAAFGVRRRDVALVSGATARTKVVDVPGADPATLAALLDPAAEATRCTPIRVADVLGTLVTVPALDRPDLLAGPVAAAAAAPGAPELFVAEIDPDLADTAAFCETYGVGLDVSANCVVVAGRRGGDTRLAGCVVLATTRADVNGVVRRRLDARKASFAPMDLAVAETGMEYGGITPVGLPDGWPVLVDSAVAATPYVVIGSGLRRSKLVLAGADLARLAGAEVLDLAT